MQFSHALIALVAAGLANAQLPDVPACSLNCFVSALTNDGCSALLDFACHCQKTELVTDITPCVKKACEVSDQISVSNAVVSQCSEAGHPISVPPIQTTEASSGSSSATQSNSSPAETSASVTATAPDSSSSAGSSSASGSNSGSASSTPTGSSSGGPSTPSSSSGSGSGSSPAGTSTPLPSKTDGSSSGSASPTFNGAVGNVKGNIAGVAVVAAAAAYIL